MGGKRKMKTYQDQINKIFADMLDMIELIGPEFTSLDEPEFATLERGEKNTCNNNFNN